MKHLFQIIATEIKNRKYILFLVLCFFLSRILLLYTSVETFFNFEELHTGTVIHDFIMGLKMPFLNYQDMYYSGETVFLGFFGIPFFLIFGKTLLALKLTITSLYALSLLIMLLFLEKHFNLKTAIITGLLFIFAPPFWIWTTLMPMYQHSESFLFVILGFYLLYNIIYQEEENSRQRYLYFALLGLINGIGLWYIYSFLIATVSYALFWVIAHKRNIKIKELLLFILFVILGFSLRIYQLGIDGMIVFNYGNRTISSYFFYIPIIEIIKRFGDILFIFLPKCSYFKNNFFSLFFYLLCGICFLSIAWLNRKVIYHLAPWCKYEEKDNCNIKAFSFVIYITVYIAALGTSSFDLLPEPDGLRYIAPIYPFCIIIIALIIERLRTSSLRYLRISSVVLLTVTMGMCIYGYISLLIPWNDKSELGRINKYKGYSNKSFDWLYGIKIGETVYLSPEWSYEESRKKHTYNYHQQVMAVGFMAQVEKETLFEYIEDIGTYKHLYYGGLGLTGHFGLPETIPEKFKAHFYENYGAGCGSSFFLRQSLFHTNKDYISQMKVNLKYADPVPDNYKPFFYEGLGRNIAFTTPGDHETYIGMVNCIEKQYQPYFCIGLGRMLGWRYIDEKEQINTINTFPQEFRPYLFQGMGLDYVYDFWLSFKNINEVISQGNNTPEKYREDYYKGLGIGAQWIALDDKTVYERVNAAIKNKKGKSAFAKGYVEQWNSESSFAPRLRGLRRTSSE